MTPTQEAQDHLNRYHSVGAEWNHMSAIQVLTALRNQGECTHSLSEVYSRKTLKLVDL